MPDKQFASGGIPCFRAVVAAALLIFSLSNPMSAAAADDSACVDRLAAKPDAPPAPPQIPQLKYRCQSLKNGGYVWVGVGGEQSAGTVLLVHGLGNNANRDWRKTVPALVPQFRVIAVDLPGFGSSPAPAEGYSFESLAGALIDVLDQHQTQRVHVVGHSLGGAVSLYFTNAHPDRVDRLVLVDAAGILHKAMFVRHIAQVEIPKIGFAPIDRLSVALESKIYEDVTLRMLRGMDTRGDFSGWLMKNPSIKNSLFGDTQVDAAIGLVEQDFTPAIRSIAAPTTLIWGRDDPVAPVRTGEMLAARLRDARLQVFDGVGHVPMNERADQFNAAALTALTQPLPPKFSVVPNAATYAEVECKDRKDAFFTGHYAVLKLKNCMQARIEFAQIGQLVLESSTASIKFATIEHSATALLAKGSRLSATAVTISGATAVVAEASELDFAGVTLRAKDRSADVGKGSRIYFSVSEIDAPDYKGDAHFVWTESTKR